MLGGEIDCSLGGVGLAPDGSWYGVPEVVFSLSSPQACAETEISDSGVKEGQKCPGPDGEVTCTITCTDESKDVTYQCVDGNWHLQPGTNGCPAPLGTMADRVGQGADVAVLVSRS